MAIDCIYRNMAIDSIYRNMAINRLEWNRGANLTFQTWSERVPRQAADLEKDRTFDEEPPNVVY